jgi:hypothetical protein
LFAFSRVLFLKLPYVKAISRSSRPAQEEGPPSKVPEEPFTLSSLAGLEIWILGGLSFTLLLFRENQLKMQHAVGKNSA